MFTLTVPQRQVLKCSIAYLIASLFTFVPVFANLLSTSVQHDVHGRVIRKPAYSAHMVATIVCYVSCVAEASALTAQRLTPPGYSVSPSALRRRDDSGFKILRDPCLAGCGFL
jgi:hypothetical protein